MNAETIKSYYGFAKKSGSVIIGTDKITASTKIYLIIASNKLAQNSIQRLERKVNKVSCPLVLLPDEEFRSFESNESILAVAIKNAELAKAMQK